MFITPPSLQTEQLLTATAVEMSVVNHGEMHLPHLLQAFSVHPGELVDVIRHQALDTIALREIVKDRYPVVDIVSPAVAEADELVALLLIEAQQWVKDDGDDTPNPLRPDHIFIQLMGSEDPEVLYVLEQVGADRLQMLDEALQVRARLDRRSTANRWL